MNDFQIGDRVYLNIPEGDGGIVIAFVVYEKHREYLVMFTDGTRQLTNTCLADSKPVI